MGRLTHGHTRGRAGSRRTSPEYRSWCAMRSRCQNPKNDRYPIYGARGVKVCDRWLGLNGFINFLSDMGPKPTSNHTLDRYPDRNGNYEPVNCRWATAKEQAENRDRSSFNAHLHKTCCPSGHSYSGANLRITSDGSRKCRECERLRARAVRRAKNMVSQQGA